MLFNPTAPGARPQQLALGSALQRLMAEASQHDEQPGSARDNAGITALVTNYRDNESELEHAWLINGIQGVRLTGG